MPRRARKLWTMRTGAHSKRKGRPNCKHAYVACYGMDLVPVMVCYKCRKVKEEKKTRDI